MTRSCAELLDRCSFPTRGTEVVCAVSGGPDSMALLALAAAADLHVTAAHVDHGLRPGSDREADVVRAAAQRFGAGFQALTASVGDGPNLEARARAARHRALPDGALLGHTMDDQAETVLLNLLRGAGSAGLAGMRPDGRRPLLGLRRSETEQLCAALDLEVVRDPSNTDRSFCAISALDSPRATRRRTSVSRAVSRSRAGGRDPAPAGDGARPSDGTGVVSLSMTRRVTSGASSA